MTKWTGATAAPRRIQPGLPRRRGGVGGGVPAWLVVPARLGRGGRVVFVRHDLWGGRLNETPPTVAPPPAPTKKRDRRGDRHLRPMTHHAEGDPGVAAQARPQVGQRVRRAEDHSVGSKIGNLTLDLLGKVLVHWIDGNPSCFDESREDSGVLTA